MKTFIILALLTLCSCATYQVEKPTNVVDTVNGVFYLDSAGVILDQE